MLLIKTRNLFWEIIVMRLRKPVINLLSSVAVYKPWRKALREKLNYFCEYCGKTEAYRGMKVYDELSRKCCKLDKNAYYIVSLGLNCFVRILTTCWKIKRHKADGELSMPFDLAVHNLPALIDMTVILTRKWAVGLIAVIILNMFPKKKITAWFLSAV